MTKRQFEIRIKNLERSGWVVLDMMKFKKWALMIRDGVKLEVQ